MDRDLDVYFRTVYAVVPDGAACFRSATTNVVETHSATLCQDVLSVLTHFDSLLAASTSDTSVTTGSDSLGLEAASLHHSASFSGSASK